jgi:hypothetical protein
MTAIVLLYFLSLFMLFDLYFASGNSNIIAIIDDINTQSVHVFALYGS